MTRFTLWTVTVSWTLLVLLSGCRSITPPVAFYTIRPMAGEAAIMDADATKITRIGILSVELPGMINRVQMVRQSGPNRVEISAFNRWADYPDRLVQLVLAQNLDMLLPGVQVVNAPWPAGFQPDITIAFQFIELIATVDRSLRLGVNWTIRAKDDAVKLQTYRRTVSETISGSGFDDLAAAHSRALETLCREVAGTLDDTLAR